MLLAIGKSQVDTMNALNARTGQVKVGSKVRFYDAKDETPAFYTKEDMATILAHWTVLDAEGNETSAFRWWLTKPERRQFSSVVFEPDLKRALPDALNLFRGFKVKPVRKEGGWSIFHDHILRNVCAGNARHAKYFLDWCASLWQRPGKKIGIAPVLYGDKGCGKSIVSDVLAATLGPHYCPSVDTPDQLVAKHNAHLAKAILIRVEEAIHAKDPRAESRIKHLVTGGRLLIEPKGVDAFEIDSKSNLIFTTNKLHAVPATGAERRFFALHCANHNRQDGRFFKALLDQMEDGGYAAFVYDMLHRDIRMTNFAKAPATDLLSQQIVESMTGLERWWCAALSAGRLPFQREPEADDSEIEWPAVGGWTVSTALVQESATDFGRDYTGAPNPKAVGRFLALNVPGIVRSRRQERGHRERCYDLPSLEDCRAAFVADRPGLMLDHVRDSIPEADKPQSASADVVPLRAA